MSCEDVELDDEQTQVSPTWTPGAIQTHYTELLRAHGPGAHAIQSSPAIQSLCFEHIASALASMPPGRLLDVGCGCGDLSPFLPVGWRYVGLDFTPALIAAARLRHRWRSFVLADAAAPPFAPASFDVAVVCKVFSYQPIEVARTMLRATWACVRRALVWLDNQYLPADSHALVNELGPAKASEEHVLSGPYRVHTLYVVRR